MYRLAANNFFGEAVRFFVEGSDLTTFTSMPEEKFKDVEAGKTYVMDVSLKAFNFKPVKEKVSGVVQDDNYGKFFGPPARYFKESLDCSRIEYPSGAITDNRSDFIEDPAQAPWAPPYIYGESVARIKYTPEVSGKPTLGDILSNAEIEYINKDLNEKFYDVGDGATNLSNPTSPAYEGRVRLDSCLSLLSKTKVKKVQFDTDNLTFSEENGYSYAPTSIKDSEGNDGDAWAIYPKWECPVFDIDEDTIDDDGFGMTWFNDANQLSQQSGVFMSIERTPNLDRTVEGSLIDICGFTPTSSKLGKVAGSKKIYEAVAIIPITETPNSETVYVNGFNCIPVKKDIFNKQLVNINSNRPAVTVGDFDSQVSIDSTSISNTITKMKEYVVPPFMNYVEDRSIDPFVFYIAEFSEELSKDDLSNIWLGKMPEIAKTMNIASKNISHKIDRFEFFGGIVPPKDMKFLVFKIKKKAEKSYFNLTADKSDDSRFEFEVFDNSTPSYSYNWPYDYFSLIDRVKISAGFFATGEGASEDRDVNFDEAIRIGDKVNRNSIMAKKNVLISNSINEEQIDIGDRISLESDSSEQKKRNPRVSNKK